MKRKVIFIVVFVLVGSCSFVGYHFYHWVKFVDDLGECGFANGPCYGVNVDLNLKTQKVDSYLDIPNGKIGFISVEDNADTLAPIIFKVDKNFKLKWALRLVPDSCGIPLNEMSGMRLSSENGRHTIHFFNQTYSEPGTIYLTEDFDFEYVCLSPM